VNDFLAKLKRLFAPRPGSPANGIGEPTADRPPPRVPEPPPVETAPPRIEAAPPPVEAASSRGPASAPEPEPREPVSLAPLPTIPPAAKHETVDVPAPVADRVGDALVLTLATPAATFTIARPGATVGRGQENTIRLDDLSVSRKHARIAYRQGGYWISDLGSMGGTWVDGTRLTAPQRLAASQVIDIGLYRLTVAFTGGAAADSKSGASKARSEMAGEARRRR
jgi:hypothetical protein